MSKRVRASAKTAKQLEDLFSGRGGGESERSDLVKLATRLIVEEALESEVEDQLGRSYSPTVRERAIATAIALGG